LDEGLLPNPEATPSHRIADQTTPQQFSVLGLQQANMAPERTDTSWDHEYHTIRREKLFRHPPTDKTAYPALQLAVDPHIESFNALFQNDDTPGLLDHALAEIGTKTFLDGDDRAASTGKNKLTVRYKSITLQRSQVPPSNKFAKRREIFPSECRERHVSYRGKLTAVMEYRVNDGEPQEFVRELGQMPIMIKVCCAPPLGHAPQGRSDASSLSRSSPTSAIWRTTPRHFSCRGKRSLRSWAGTSSSTASKRLFVCSWSTEGTSRWLSSARVSKTEVLHTRHTAS
jgi:DNA-directed RNA polymerase beta subunit